MDQWIRQIDEQGYCRIPSLVGKAELNNTLQLVNQWRSETEFMLPDDLPPLVRDQVIVYNLQNKDIRFLKLLFSLPVLWEVLTYYLNDDWYKKIPPDKPNFIMRSFLARSSDVALPLHIDSMFPYQAGRPIVMQCMLMLEDMDESNGCTLFVPGSQHSGEYVGQESLVDAVPVPARAGDLLIWDARIWHGALENKSNGGTRWSLIATFTRWWIKQAFDITGTLRQEIFDQLDDEQKAVLGFCSVPYKDEFSGIDFRLGYDDLPEH